MDFILHLQKLRLKCTGTTRDNRVKEKNILEKNICATNLWAVLTCMMHTAIMYFQASITNAHVIFNATRDGKKKVGIKELIISIA
ncbi:hypothetical protein TSAR_009752 [Trichomalopsis sarcophagae]|uniref:Uncharacterized protein n=1 Tax=Trichomalopsis sarcophagae TaxID=543379 RepID=A0A232FKW3_9HYME|nr:hypothetical protein TSAR_009752 [Trichomalopsis sarcophagae]